jgi:hypothetical protein
MDKSIKSGWYNSDILPLEMVKGAKAEIPGWKKLEYTEHFPILDELIKELDPISICDIGCGSAEISRIYPNLIFLGLDLPHIIKKVSLVVNPGKKYMDFDANTQENFSFLKEYDLLLMNGFLSEIENPMKFMEKILNQYEGNILIHRQDLTDSEGFLEEYNSYGGIVTTNSVMNIIELTEMCSTNGYVIKRIENSGISGSDKKTILIKKI